MKLAIDQSVLTIGATALVTVSVESENAVEGRDLTLTLDLPPALATTTGEKNKLVWQLPTLAVGQTFVQSVQVVIDQPKQALKRGVLSLVAEVSAPSYDKTSASVLLGVSPEMPNEMMSQSAEGALLQSATGDVTLLAPPGAVAEGVNFSYRAVHHWKKAGKLVTENPTEPGQELPEPTPVTATLGVTVAQVAITQVPLTVTAAVTSPIPAAPVTEGVSLSQPVATAPLTATTSITRVQPISEGNVSAYVIWHLAAEQNGQAVTRFDQAVLLEVAVHELVAQGVDPTQLTIFTRPDASEAWQEVPNEYDAEQQRFRAWLPHFSDFTLGQGLTLHGQVLPSVRAFSTDRFTGVATVNYPLETPKGLGGLAPNLSLSYSSLVVDDMYQNNGPDAYKAQGSGIGLGWSLGGISYIVRASKPVDNGAADTVKEFILVLNGQHVRIKYEQFPHNGGQIGRWVTDPEIFAKIE